MVIGISCICCWWVVETMGCGIDGSWWVLIGGRWRIWRVEFIWVVGYDCNGQSGWVVWLVVLKPTVILKISLQTSANGSSTWILKNAKLTFVLYYKEFKNRLGECEHWAVEWLFEVVTLFTPKLGGLKCGKLSIDLH